MFADIKRLSKQTLVYGAGNVLTRMIAFFLLPVFTHWLPPDQYSTYTQFYIAITVGMAIIVLGLDISLLRYYVLEKELERRRLIFSTVFWGAFLASGILFVVMLVWSGNIVHILLTLPEPYPDWAGYTLQLCAGIMILDVLSTFPTIVMRSENQPGRFVFVNIASAVAQLSLAILFVTVFNRGVAGIFEANLISSALRIVLCLPTVIGRLRPVFNRKVLWDCLQFGLPNVPNLLFVTLVEMSDRWLLGHIRGAYENGIYSAGYRLGMFLSVVAMGFRYAWQPFFLQIAHRKDAKEIYARVLTYYAAIVLWLFLILVAWIEPIARWNIPFIGFLIAPEYWPGLKVFPIILLAHVFNGIYAIFMVGVYLEKRTRTLPLITGIAAIINIGGNILLMPRFGMWAAAWMTVASWVVMAGLLYFYIQRYYPVQYEWSRIAFISFWTIFFFAIILIGWSARMDWVGCLFSAAFPLVFLSGKFLTESEKERLGKFVGLRL